MCVSGGRRKRAQGEEKSEGSERVGKKEGAT